MRPDRPAGAPRRRSVVRLALAVSLVVTVALPTGPALAGITSPYVRRSIVQLAPGIMWEKGVARTSQGVQAIQIGRIDTRNPQVGLRSLLSNDRVVRLEKPSLNADRNSRAGALAMIATNGDVSTVGDTGAGAVMPSMHIHAGELMVGTSCGRPTLGVDADGTARIAWVKNRITFDMTSRLPGYQGTIALRGINRRPGTNQLSLYTPRMGPSTLTVSNGIDVILDPEGRIAPDGRTDATVVEVRIGVHDTLIPTDGMVLTGLGEKAMPLKLLHPGDRVSFLSEIGVGTGNQCSRTERLSAWKDTAEAMGGNYFTCLNGRNVAPSAAEYAKGGVAAPRTNVGITADGTILMVVVDGRQGGYSIGMSLIEMGDLMLSLGAVSAFNLDGGGSSVMATRRAGAEHITVSNRPSDGSERNLTQALSAFSVTNP